MNPAERVASIFARRAGVTRKNRIRVAHVASRRARRFREETNDRPVRAHPLGIKHAASAIRNVGEIALTAPARISFHLTIQTRTPKAAQRARGLGGSDCIEHDAALRNGGDVTRKRRLAIIREFVFLVLEAIIIGATDMRYATYQPALLGASRKKTTRQPAPEAEESAALHHRVFLTAKSLTNTVCGILYITAIGRQRDASGPHATPIRGGDSNVRSRQQPS